MSTAALSQSVLNGLALSGIYILIALGLTLVMSIMGIVQVAHGEIYMIGAYSVYYMVGVLGGNFFVGIIASTLFVGGVGGPGVGHDHRRADGGLLGHGFDHCVAWRSPFERHVAAQPGGRRHAPR